MLEDVLGGIFGETFGVVFGDTLGDIFGWIFAGLLGGVFGGLLEGFFGGILDGDVLEQIVGGFSLRLYCCSLIGSRITSVCKLFGGIGLELSSMFFSDSKNDKSLV